MTSTLVGVRDRIVTVLEALTPEVDAARTYKHWTSPGLPHDAEGHRCFTIRWAEGGTYHAHGSSMSEQRSRLEVRVLFSFAGIDTEAELFARATTEGVNLANAIDRDSGWPAGTLMVQTENRKLEFVEDSADVELVIDVIAEVEES